MRRSTQILALLTCLLFSSPAFAQFFATDDRAEFISASTSTSSAIVAGIIMLTVVNTKKDPTVLQRYLRENEPAVRAAFAIGGGDVVADLAAFLDVPLAARARFGVLLRRHRHKLLRAAFTHADPREFTQLVEAALTYDRAIASR